MRNTVFIAILAFCSCQSGDNNQTTKEELKNLLTEYYNALSNKDLSKMNELTTSNFVLFDEGLVFDNASAVKSVEELGKFTATFKFDSLNAYVDKANTSVYYFREATFTFGDSTYPPVGFLESATFRKEGDQWKLRFLHSSQRK